MYDDVAVLRDYEPTGFDDYGNRVTSASETTVFVQPRGVYASEFYNASQLGLKPSITFELANRADYDGQKIIVFHGIEYNIIRNDWNAQRDKCSLICEKRINND